MDTEHGFVPPEAKHDAEEADTLVEGRAISTEGDDVDSADLEEDSENNSVVPPGEVQALVSIVKSGEAPSSLGLENLNAVAETTVDGNGLVTGRDTEGNEIHWSKDFAEKLQEGYRLGLIADAVVSTFADRMDGAAKERIQAAREIAQQIAWSMPDRKQATDAVKIAAEHLARASKEAMRDFSADVTRSGWSKKFLARAQESVQRLFKGKKYTEHRESLAKGLEDAGYEVADVTSALEEIDDGLESGNITKAQEVLNHISAQLAEEKPTYRVVTNRELIAFVNDKLDKRNHYMYKTNKEGELSGAVDLTDVPTADALDKSLAKQKVKAHRKATRQARAARDLAAEQARIEDDEETTLINEVEGEEYTDSAEDETLTSTRERAAAEKLLDEAPVSESSEEEGKDLDLDDESEPGIPSQNDTEIRDFPWRPFTSNDDVTEIFFENSEDAQAEVQNIQKLVEAARTAKPGTVLALMAELNPETYAEELAFICQGEPKKPGFFARLTGGNRKYTSAMEKFKQSQEYIAYWQNIAMRAIEEQHPSKRHPGTKRTRTSFAPGDQYGGLRGTSVHYTTPSYENPWAAENHEPTTNAEDDSLNDEWFRTPQTDGHPEEIKHTPTSDAFVRGRSGSRVSTDRTGALIARGSSRGRPSVDYPGLTNEELRRDDTPQTLPASGSSTRGINPSAEKRGRKAA